MGVGGITVPYDMPPEMPRSSYVFVASGRRSRISWGRSLLPDVPPPEWLHDDAGDSFGERTVLEIRERDFASFFRVPFDVYEDPAYVSNMRSDLARILSDANPLFGDTGRFTYFTAHRGTQPVGRIVCHVHRASNERHRLARGSFGFFDCVDDEEVAGRLLGSAEEWLAGQGCEEMAGNFNLTPMQQLGVVTDGFGGVPYTDMQYNPRHIPRLLEGSGFEAFFPMTTHELDLRAFDPRTLVPESPGNGDVAMLRWVPLRRRGFLRLMEATRTLLNESFDRNPMFVPLTSDEFLFQARELMWIIDERISNLVYLGDRPVGAVVCIPDLNPLLRSVGSRFRLTFPVHYLKHLLRRRRAVILFWAVHPSMWGQGLNPIMVQRVTTALKRAGYTDLGLTWIADVNQPSLRQIEKLGARRLHRLHLFRKSIRSARA